MSSNKSPLQYGYELERKNPVIFISVDVALPSVEGDYRVWLADGSVAESRWNVRILSKPIRFLPLAHSYWSIEMFCDETVTHWEAKI
ncbi:hypothetical protein [Thalassolituus sp. UBA3500]|uniref:hypothetical protein n=1 Tax=Thalassolituus sp. UBA3500 TaxID=1947664 RepID=UPI000C0F472D|nr:hypothetical protein [Thalassolituus sp. UBA3500]MBN58768.1 hypothetical protein [Oceanospirillaceae bacterium]|tara:strand:- start:4112 stop:4372 length:261 start_codon:yes stop_codon:yes gene_type:complete